MSGIFPFRIPYPVSDEFYAALQMKVVLGYCAIDVKRLAENGDDRRENIAVRHSAVNDMAAAISIYSYPELFSILALQPSRFAAAAGPGIAAVVAVFHDAAIVAHVPQRNFLKFIERNIVFRHQRSDLLNRTTEFRLTQFFGFTLQHGNLCLDFLVGRHLSFPHSR
jgi:hypothetical protein